MTYEERMAHIRARMSQRGQAITEGVVNWSIFAGQTAAILAGWIVLLFVPYIEHKGLHVLTFVMDLATFYWCCKVPAVTQVAKAVFRSGALVVRAEDVTARRAMNTPGRNK